MKLKLYNSLTRQLEEFEPINQNRVGIYTCGMTVYDYAHIGHGRKYVYDDILRRTLVFMGYQVKHVQNVTDVGHMVSDADEGEDKLEKGARKFGKTVWEVAQFFTDHFYRSIEQLNILKPDVVCKATDHIADQVAMVEQLIAKGYAYETPEAVYFEVSKFPQYGNFFGQKLEDKLVAARDEVETGSHKRHPADFALWFKRVGRFSDHSMHWPSPWGDGFPGWHIECSAMSIKYLGPQFDIHTGGEDHLTIHHPNEIAQAEAATGKTPFVRFWIHHAFLLVDGTKMSKSLGNFYTIEDVLKKGIDPLALRYFYLTSHYRKQQNFTWEALNGAASALTKLRQRLPSTTGPGPSNEELDKLTEYRDFLHALADDLNMPEALAVVWRVAKDQNLDPATKQALMREFDQVLGLDLKSSPKETQLPTEIGKLIASREDARARGDYQTADIIRQELSDKGYLLEDGAEGTRVTKT